jgi:hypothetical protein
MIEVNVEDSGIRPDLWKDAVAVAVSSRAMFDSGLLPFVDLWLSRASLPDARMLLSMAAATGTASEPDLVSACRRYAWLVSNAAYTVTDEQIHELHALGLSDAEVLDLTLAVALFAGLAIVEPLIRAASPARPA